MKDSKKAFHWIITILKKHKIPFQITMGLAAKSYGSERELADIDFAIPKEFFDILLEDTKQHIITGPEQSIDDHWNIYFVEIEYANQKIELGETQFKIFDKNVNKWIDYSIDLSKFETKTLFGIKVPVMAKQVLIDIKKKLQREVDILDLEQLN